MWIYVRTYGPENVLEFAAGCLFEGPNVRILTDRRLLVVKASCRASVAVRTPQIWLRPRRGETVDG